jgi:N-acetylmuramoyl-L-alanine amidase
VRFESEYILLSTAPWKNPGGEWYVAEDFIARALSLVLDEPLRRAGLYHYRLGSASIQIDMEMVNWPNQVRIVLRASQFLRVSIIEYSDRLEVALGAAAVNMQFSPIQPNPEIVASLREADGILTIRKGFRYERFEESQMSSGTAFMIDLFGTPSAIVYLPPRPSAPAEKSDVPPEHLSGRFDHLQDWKPGPIERRGSAVVIDPGHGGEDTGVVEGNLLEKDIALEVAFRIQSILEAANHSCQLTRTRDVTLPIEKRSGVANYYQPETFVSIHVGRAPSTSTRALTIYVSGSLQSGSTETPESGAADELVAWRNGQDAYHGKSRQLAQLIRKELAALSVTTPVIVPAPLSLLSPIRAPAVLIEIGYLTNSSQRARLESQGERAFIAEAIAQSISSFLDNTQP